MSKSRFINTHFWSDNYIIDLDPIEKLLFLYLLTNEKTNMLGVYEIHIRRISFDTGIDRDMVLKIFDRFEVAGKAKYHEGYVILSNFIKHQNFNTNMEVSAIKCWNELPLEVRNNDFCKPILKGLKGLTKASEPIAEYEYEYEYESEVECEDESEDKSTITTDVDEVPNASDVETWESAKRVAGYLLEAICESDPTHKYAKNPPSLNGWVKDIDRAIRLDGRTEDQFRFLIDAVFRNCHEFTDLWHKWHMNIESGKKLRDQFDKIKNQIISSRNGNPKKPTKGDLHAQALRSL